MNHTQKHQIIQQLEQHYKNDEIIKGQYWEDGKGCAIGCIAHSDSDPHEKVAEMLDIPLWMAYLIDTIFEELPNKDAKEFPLRFVKAKPESADPEKLELIRHNLALYQLNHICNDTDNEIVKDAIEKVKELHQRALDGQTVSTEEWSAAWSAAELARSAAWSAAELAAESAAWSAWSAAELARSAAWSAAELAAESATRSAGSAARSAWSAARSAWSAAELARSAARSAGSAARSAGSAAYKKIADKLIEYVKEAATQ